MAPQAAAIFLPFALAIGVWVAFSDLARMKIPNLAVGAALAVWLVVGLAAVVLTPLTLMQWGWGWAIGAGVFLAGFIGYAAGAIGAGDVKFAGAAAPFLTGAEPRLVLGLFAAAILGAFATHRLARAIPAIRRATPGWQSWTHAKFPMGLALSGTWIFALFAQILPAF